MTETSSMVLARESKIKRRRVKGGTRVCPWCDQERVPGSSFCLEHKREYAAEWSRNRTKELKKLRALIGSTT